MNKKKNREGILLSDYLSQLMIIIFLGSILTINVGCHHNKMKFDSDKWKEQPDLAYTPPYRDEMLLDLTKNQKLIGLKYCEVIKMLGYPNIHDSTSLTYSIVIEYGHDIDPIYIKSLILTMSKDSTVTNCNIYKWKK